MNSNAAQPDILQAIPAEIDAAVVREAHGDFKFERLKIDLPRSDEVLVRIVATGLCHTDIAVRDQKIRSPLPIVLGHEGSGIIVAKGDSVRELAIGDHVVITYLSCGECKQCHSGQSASCVRFGLHCFSGGRSDGSHALHSHDGSALNDQFFGQSSFATHAIANERNVVKVRRDAPLELLGPLACGVMTGAGTVWNELQVKPGESFAVFGAGAVGLSAVMAAKVSGASRIVVVDRVESRLKLAVELGATHVIDARMSDTVDALREFLPMGVDRALETTGRFAVTRAAISSLAQRGEIALVAASEAGELGIGVSDLIRGSKRIRGVVEGGGSAHLLIPMLLDLFMAGRFPFDRLIRTYPFTQINQAVADSNEGRAIKPVLLMDQSRVC
jgi:aryl-alcohol dehydrogenase